MGFQQFVQNILATAKSGDQEKLAALIKEAEIPDYRAYFSALYGQEGGERVASAYARDLQTREMEFQEYLTQLAQQPDAEYFTLKLDGDAQRKRFTHITRELDIYFANWKKSGSPENSNREPIGYFTFQDEKFRWDSTIKFIRNMRQARLIKRVEPVYPLEAKARRIEGVVTLSVIIGKDGSVKILRVLAGDPILSPAAVDAVRQWHYEPLLSDGQPLEVQTSINVTFSLNH